MVTLDGEVGTTPLSQFVPSVQSVLVAPVQFCAAAGRERDKASAAELTPVRNLRCVTDLTFERPPLTRASI
jgi:hypothetical protein